MDPSFSPYTLNNTNPLIPILPPGITPPTTTPLLVPKLEPLDEIGYPHSQNEDPNPQPQFHPQAAEPNSADVAGHGDTDPDPEIYAHFFRVSDLFRDAFGDAATPQLDAVVPDPNENLGASLSLSLNSFAAPDDAAELDPDSRAIVPVPPPPPPEPEDPSNAVAIPVKRRKKMKELVRINDLTADDNRHFREVVRRTRLIYDSIRVFASIEEERRVAEEKRVATEQRLAEEKRVQEEEMNGVSLTTLVTVAAAAAPAETAESESPPVPESGGDQQPENNDNAAADGGVTEVLEAAVKRRGRIRGDLKAAALMRDQGLWLNREKRIVGAIPGVKVGDLFLFRMELCVLGLHHQVQAGIDYLPAICSPNGEPIATSVIVSGGYEDDMDDGEVIIYTGQGGQAANSLKQVSDQKLESGNLALERSMHHGIEVRVIRGMRYEGSASKSGKVYVYDGLYRIVDCWFECGKSGFGVYKYRLVRIEGQPKMGSAILKEARDVRRLGVDYKPLHCISVDISNKKERFPVRLFNDLDDNDDPLFYDYLSRATFPQFVFHQSVSATGCDCVDGCVDGCFCFMKNGGDFPYTQQGMLVRGKPLIFECGPFCSCPPSCRNRVAQHGLKNRMEVFRSQQTGWGVRSLDLIQAGALICEYAGVVLTREQAEILKMNGDSLIYPNRFSRRWAEWGDLSQIYSDYEQPSYPSIPPLDFSLDVSRMRNVACYMSHSSSPNVLVQYVLYDHNNLMFPHIILFAMENIPPMRELSIDYGVADEWTGKLSICNG